MWQTLLAPKLESWFKPDLQQTSTGGAGHHAGQYWCDSSKGFGMDLPWSISRLGRASETAIVCVKLFSFGAVVRLNAETQASPPFLYPRPFERAGK
jgi:hypothetical protein